MSFDFLPSADESLKETHKSLQARAERARKEAERQLKVVVEQIKKARSVGLFKIKAGELMPEALQALKDKGYKVVASRLPASGCGDVDSIETNISWDDKATR